ncbi:MAG: diguanylate cyclase [Fuerstiella sp.]|jgi:diguanylate cyclase (GGDEF)-like protein|nr:diguanylate cyclase [Fuerstiella sp.]MDG2131506.1 GGDEF domain-containing protein [Fuerstiella sp.]
MTEHQERASISLAETCVDAYEFLAHTNVQPGKACLLQIYPARSDSEMMRLTRERTSIGREPSCDISVDDNAMSRTHAAVDLLGGRYFLVDLNSTNGTYVDDDLLRGRMPLAGGELIRMGGCIMKFMSSMDEEANYHAVVHELMTRDALTNAFNRSYLIPVIDKELELCRKQNERLSLILLDIDHFKNINDQHGHLVGDEVLRIFCERIRGELRKTDLLTRFGGEEFIVACCRTPLRGAGRIAERIRLAIASTPFQTQAGRINVTCSLGVSSSDGVELASCDNMVSAADALLYDAKNSGRNRVLMFDPQDTRCDGNRSQDHDADTSGAAETV